VGGCTTESGGVVTSAHAGASKLISDTSRGHAMRQARRPRSSASVIALLLAMIALGASRRFMIAARLASNRSSPVS
jgi:hypothetical protein